MFECVGDGQYLMFKLLTDRDVIFNEIMVFDRYEIAGEATLTDDGTVTWDVSRGGLTGTSDGRSLCPKGSSSGTVFNINFEFNNPVVVSDIIVFAWSDNMRIKSYTAKVLYAGDPTPRSRPTVTISTARLKQKTSIDPTSTAPQDQVNISKITLVFTLGSDKTFDGLCKIGIFSEYLKGEAVPNYPSWTFQTISFDLLE